MRYVYFAVYFSKRLNTNIHSLLLTFSKQALLLYFDAFEGNQDFNLSVSITDGGRSEAEMGRKDALVSRLFLDFHIFSLLLLLGTLY